MPLSDGERSLFHVRLLEAANAVSSGEFHPGEVKNLLREAAARLVGYEAFQEAGTQHDEDGDPIWEFYDAKLWRSILFWKQRCEEYRVALQDVQGIALNGSPTTGDDDSPWLRLDAIDVRVIKVMP